MTTTGNFYSLAQRTSDGTSGKAAWELIATKGVLVREIGISLAEATASTFGLGVPAAKGVTPTTPVTFKNEKLGGTAAQAKGALAWGTGPTLPAAFVRRIALPATIGEGIVWRFERGLIVPAGTTLVLWNLAANALIDVWAAIQE